MHDYTTYRAIIIFAVVALIVFALILKRKTGKREENQAEEDIQEYNREEMEIIRIYTYHHEVAVIRARLESEGIHTFLADEQTLSANPLMANAIGGLKLMVPKAEAARAREILKEDD